MCIYKNAHTCTRNRHSGVERVALPGHQCRAVNAVIIPEVGLAAAVTTCGGEVKVSCGVWSVTSLLQPSTITRFLLCIMMSWGPGCGYSVP